MNIDQLTCYSNYALYRLPEHDSCTLLAQTQGEPLVVEAVSQLAGRKGFVMAPFEPTASHPILLMQPDVVETMAVEGEAADEAGVDPATDDADGREAYHRGFERFHAELATGRVGKLVLSRCVRQQMPGDMDVRRLFMQACRRYPHQYIALVSMQRSGTWLMATPEVLLDGDGRHWHTMALAGTMRMGGGGTAMEGVEWSEKNKAEQQYVSRYIEEILSRLATDVKMHGPYTTMAAHLLHLRTDFGFTLPHGDGLGRLLDALHPTPAVCGMPKAAARRFIVSHESVDRAYYSGFCGPLDLQGATHLYVSLRCMAIEGRQCSLYAGGGLLCESVEQQEWQETQTKLQTMRRLLT